MASRSRDQSSTETPARPAPTASRAVSATPSGSSANPFSRSADTGTSLADAIWAAWVIASSRVTEPSRRPSDAAKPLLVVARASKPSAASRRAEPISHGLGMSSGAPGRCSSKKRAASAAWSVLAMGPQPYPPGDGYAEWMSTQPSALSLGREAADDGSFRRQESVFRGWVTAHGSSRFPVEAGRYHLYVARACPWAHRTLIGRELMGLQDAIGVSFVHPRRDERGWAFTGDGYTDPVNGFRFLAEAYQAADADYEARVTVPVLWDKDTGTIVNNESADILRMLSTVFAPLAEHPVELYPGHLGQDIDALNAPIYDTGTNAVYKAGFATQQTVYA